MNIEFLEKNILFQSIKSPYYLGSIIDHIDVKYFSNNNVKSILSVILKFYKEYDKYPNLTEIKTLLNDESLKKSFKLVVDEFKNLDKDVDVDILIKQTEQFFRERAVYNTMLDVAENIKQYKHADVLKKFEKSCGISLITDIGMDYFKDIDSHIEWLKQQVDKISTGYEFLDKKIKGGFNKNGRGLHVILGGTNSGKSIVLGNIAANVVRQNYCVPIISLEMGENYYAQRMSANFSSISVDDLKDNTEDLKNIISNIQEKTPNSKLIIKEFAPGCLTPNGLDNYLDMLKKKGYNFDLVVLDYITLMKSEGDNLYEKGKRLAEDVRSLTYKHNVDILTAIQANRGGVKENTQPKLDNTSESMGIAHTADLMVSVWREEEDIETNTIRMGVIKNRIGENFGVQMFEFDTRYLRLTETEKIFENDLVEMQKQITREMENIESYVENM